MPSFDTSGNFPQPLRSHIQSFVFVSLRASCQVSKNAIVRGVGWSPNLFIFDWNPNIWNPTKTPSGFLNNGAESEKINLPSLCLQPKGSARTPLGPTSWMTRLLQRWGQTRSSKWDTRTVHSPSLINGSHAKAQVVPEKTAHSTPVCHWHQVQHDQGESSPHQCAVHPGGVNWCRGPWWGRQ